LNNEAIKYQQEDEIDLKELWKTLMKRKWFIVIFTSIVTILAIIFSLVKTPIYEATALIEIGDYSTSNGRIQLGDASQLADKLNVLYIDMFKNIKDKDAEISSISVPKKQNNFLEIKSLSPSNDLATKEIQKVVIFIQNKHQKILDDVKQRRELEIKNIEVKISNIKNNQVVLLEDKITLQEENLMDYKRQLALIDNNLKKIETLNPALAALKLMEKRDLSTFIVNLNLQLMDMINTKDQLETIVINDLYEKKNLAKSMLLPYNYKNSEIIGAIITNDYPIKPKKELIVLVAFVTGLIVSIFIVFFLNFIKNEEE
jgi:capsular polysaccharide biosynthesis protein